MITILTMLETGYESTFEHLAFRQLKGAYKCNLVCVPHDFPTLQEALDSVDGTLVFMVPPNRTENSIEFKNFNLPEGNVIFVFGSPQENLVTYIKNEISSHITTKGNSDMMAVCVAGIVLNVHG